MDSRTNRESSRATWRAAILGLFFASTLARAQGVCAHRGRTAVIGGAIGAGFVVGMALAQSNHGLRSGDALPYGWGAAWGATLGSALPLATHGCLQDPAPPRYLHGCAAAARSGALKGAAGGALGGFLIAPIAALPILVPTALGPSKKFNFDHFIGMFTLGGAVFGAPVGATAEHRRCTATFS